MKTTTKRILSLVLAVVMVCSLCVYAFADEAETPEYKQFNKMLCIGDSVCETWSYDDMYFANAVADATGIDRTYDPDTVISGSNGVARDRYGYIRFDSYKSNGTLPELNVENVSSADRIILGYSGLRSTEALIALGGAEVDETDPYYGATSSPTKTIADAAYKNSEYYIEAAKQSDLIVLEVGVDDVLYYAQEISGLMNLDFGNLGDVDIPAFLENYTSLLYQGYSNFKSNFPALIERIQQIKGDSDYTLVACSVYNPVNELQISSDIVSPIGDLAATITTLINADIERWSEEYGFAYADISDVPTAAMTDGYTLADFSSGYTACIATHPKYEVGYAYIARQILAQLPYEKECVDFNVRIDLGAVNSVSAVSLDFKTLDSSKYSYDEATHVLTVYQALPTASTCRVSSKNADGTTYVAFYALSFDISDGYSAKLLYSTTDVVSTTTKFVKNVNSIGSKLTAAVKGLFTK